MHDYEKEKLTRTANLYDQTMDAMQLGIKQDHEARMADLAAKKDMMKAAMGGAKTIQWHSRQGNTQHLRVLQEESRQAGRSIALSPTSPKAIGHSGDAVLAITDATNGGKLRDQKRPEVFTYHFTFFCQKNSRGKSGLLPKILRSFN